MIRGVHTLSYSSQAEELREFIRHKLLYQPKYQIKLEA